MLLSTGKASVPGEEGYSGVTSGCDEPKELEYVCSSGRGGYRDIFIVAVETGRMPEILAIAGMQVLEEPKPNTLNSVVRNVYSSRRGFAVSDLV